MERLGSRLGTIRELLGNLFGTVLERLGNLVGTCGELLGSCFRTLSTLFFSTLFRNLYKHTKQVTGAPRIKNMVPPEGSPLKGPY